MDLSRFARRRYSAGATPLEFLPNFTNALGGPKVWIKRDDMLGLAPGGNKTRKLEFLVAEALAHGADTLITCGAPQSNHCRITLAAAIKEGLHCRFVIEERVPSSYQREASGNNFLFRLLGVEAITVVSSGADMAAAMQQVATALATQGRKGYIIPGGGSNALGGLGYVACAQELQQQFFCTRCPYRSCRGGVGQFRHPWRTTGWLYRQQHPHTDCGYRGQPRSGRARAFGAS